MDCEYAIPELEQQTVLTHSNFNNASLTVTGSYPQFSEIRSLNVGLGRFYDWNDMREARRVAFLGSDVNKVFIPFSAMRRDFPDKPPGTPTTFDQLLVTPKSVEQHEACKHEVRVALARMHRYDRNDKEACPIWDTVQEAKAFRQMTDGMKYFLGAVGIVTLLLGGIGVMNVMLVAVRERTREIGVRKAIGAPAGTILRQFFVEALIIALLSGGIGLGVAFGFCALSTCCRCRTFLPD